ncbi:MAG: carbohydrate ABC transporter permease [Clostridia bacterium]|nr:carbohydrate ABC transporter permease [Clostridia bacterium]
MAQNAAHAGGRQNRKLNHITAGDIIIATLVTLLCFSMLYPFVNIVFQSLSTNAAITASNGMMLWPSEVTFDNYRYVFTYPNVWNAYKNTLFITFVGTALSLVLTTMGAYALSKRDLPGRTFMTVVIIITMWVGGGLIPGYLNLRRLGLINTRWVMIIPGCISTGNLLLMRNFFLAQPLELKESAYIDGASELRTLLNIVLPLSMAIMATMALFYGVGYWNAYSGAILYNNRVENYPIQVVIHRMYSMAVVKNMDPEWLATHTQIASDAVRAATVVFGTLPIMCVYPFLQKYFAKGVMVGSLKG